MLTAGAGYLSSPISPLKNETYGVSSVSRRTGFGDSPTAAEGAAWGGASSSAKTADTVTISAAAKGMQANDAKTQEDDRKIRELKAIQARVIAHEMAHKGAGGPYAGAVSYSYTKGPDGRMYITGGEVAIDVSEGRTPEETIAKARIVERAALAPMDPSPQDRQVAAQAAMMETEAAREIRQEAAAEAARSGEGAAGAAADAGPAPAPSAQPPAAPAISIRA